jgi:Domain of unknown function (DUF4160)
MRRGSKTPGACFRFVLASVPGGGEDTLVRMSPTVLRDGPFRLYFFSREEVRVHVHVAHPDGEAKFWLTPSVSLAVVVGLSATQIADAQRLVERHLEDIQDAWIRHFNR